MEVISLIYPKKCQSLLLLGNPHRVKKYVLGLDIWGTKEMIVSDTHLLNSTFFLSVHTSTLLSIIELGNGPLDYLLALLKISAIKWIVL